MSSSVSFSAWVNDTTSNSASFTVFNNSTAEPVTIDTIRFYVDASSSSYITYSVNLKAGLYATFNVPGLEAGEKYTSRILCVSTSEGTEAYQDITYNTSAGDIYINTVYVSSKSTKISWDSPPSRTNKITIDVRIDSDVQKIITLDKSATSAIVTDLTTATKYTLQVNMLDSDDVQIRIGVNVITPAKVDKPGAINPVYWIGNKITASWSNSIYAKQYYVEAQILGYAAPIAKTEYVDALNWVYRLSSATPDGSGTVTVNVYAVDYDGVLSDSCVSTFAYRENQVTPFVVVKKENGKLHKYRVWCRKNQLWNIKNIYIKIDGVLRYVKNKYLY